MSYEPITPEALEREGWVKLDDLPIGNLRDWQITEDDETYILSEDERFTELWMADDADRYNLITSVKDMPHLRAIIAALDGEPDPALIAARAELATVKAERDALAAKAATT